MLILETRQKFLRHSCSVWA